MHSLVYIDYIISVHSYSRHELWRANHLTTCLISKRPADIFLNTGSQSRSCSSAKSTAEQAPCLCSARTRNNIIAPSSCFGTHCARTGWRNRLELYLPMSSQTSSSTKQHFPPRQDSHVSSAMPSMFTTAGQGTSVASGTHARRPPPLKSNYYIVSAACARGDGGGGARKCMLLLYDPNVEMLHVPVC